VQRSHNELARARKVQSDKNSHHTQDVEELDETAVNSVDDQQQHGDDRRQDQNPRHSQEEPEEKVEISALTALPPESSAKMPAKASKTLPPQLDISA
jgi:hypothetical protein